MLLQHVRGFHNQHKPPRAASKHPASLRLDASRRDGNIPREDPLGGGSGSWPAGRRAVGWRWLKRLAWGLHRCSGAISAAPVQLDPLPPPETPPGRGLFPPGCDQLCGIGICLSRMLNQGISAASSKSEPACELLPGPQGLEASRPAVRIHQNSRECRRCSSCRLRF